MGLFNSLLTILTNQLQFSLLLAAYLLKPLIFGYIIYFSLQSFNLYIDVCLLLEHSQKAFIVFKIMALY